MVSTPLRELHKCRLQVWGPFLSDEHPPVCSCFSSTFPPRLAAFPARGWTTFSKKSSEAPWLSGHRGAEASAVACPLAFLLFHVKKKKKQNEKPTTTPKPFTTSSSHPCCGDKGPRKLSLNWRQRRSPIATWTPPPTLFPVPAAVPSWAELVPSRVHPLSPPNVPAPSETAQMKEGHVEKTSHAQLSPSRLWSPEETCIGGISETQPSE